MTLPGDMSKPRSPASVEPSGDQDRGTRAWPPASGGSGSAFAAPSGCVRSSIQVCTPSVVASRFPSGDHSESHREGPVVFVSCSSPLPSGRIVHVS